MRALIAIAALMGGAGMAVAEPAAENFLDHGEPPPGYLGGLGLITTLGPTGLFQNATSGIIPKYAFSVESCMGFKENNGDHFNANGVLLTYGVTDWLEVSGFGLIASGLDLGPGGGSTLEIGQINVRARLTRDEGAMPEITVGGIGAFGDDPLVAHSLFLAASKGFALSDGPAMRSVRVHAGIRETWPDIGQDITTGFVGLELEVVRNLYLIGEVNTRDDSFTKTPWSAGLQYKSNSFGMSLAVLQAPNESAETIYVGIGVSY